MVYLVKTTLRAERDLAALYAEINAEESERARQWYFKLKAAILELGEMPNRHPITRENKRLRHSLFGHKPHVYRVIFRIRKRLRQVEVLHVRHGRRRDFRTIEPE
ncbi:MAG: type II toxin-antitoxin system RelE/ParE family toxin [Terriglobales bacterium]|jgi:plasmid stabilization system protein ParE